MTTSNTIFFFTENKSHKNLKKMCALPAKGARFRLAPCTYASGTWPWWASCLLKLRCGVCSNFQHSSIRKEETSSEPYHLSNMEIYSVMKIVVISNYRCSRITSAPIFFLFLFRQHILLENTWTSCSIPFVQLTWSIHVETVAPEARSTNNV